MVTGVKEKDKKKRKSMKEEFDDEIPKKKKKKGQGWVVCTIENSQEINVLR